MVRVHARLRLRAFAGRVIFCPVIRSRTLQEVAMTNVMIAVMAGALCAAGSAVLAQTSTDKAKESMVQQSTQGAVDTTGSRATAAQDAKDTAVSKKKAKPTKTQREADLKAMEGKVDSSGGRATPKQDAKNTAVAKDMSKKTRKMG